MLLFGLVYEMISSSWWFVVWCSVVRLLFGGWWKRMDGWMAEAAIEGEMNNYLIHNGCEYYWLPDSVFTAVDSNYGVLIDVPRHSNAYTRAVHIRGHHKPLSCLWEPDWMWCNSHFSIFLSLPLTHSWCVSQVAKKANKEILSLLIQTFLFTRVFLSWWRVDVLSSQLGRAAAAATWLSFTDKRWQTHTKVKSKVWSIVGCGH